MSCKLKICGVTRIKDACGLVELGVDALGVNFWEGSKRFIRPQDAQPFLEEVRGKIQRVGVFVNEDILKVKQIFDDGLIDTAQLHGDEDASYCHEMAQNNINFIKVIRVPKENSTITMPEPSPEHILLDTFVPNFGGAGEIFDWKLAKEFIKHHPLKKVILAGGITTENIDQALLVKPYMIDVASGAESQPGVKDLDLTKEMLRILRNT